MDDEFPLWDTNWPIFEAFCDISTQWRTGMAGATGLDYPAVIQTLKALEVPKWKKALKGIKAMEREILKVWSEDRDKVSRK